MDLIAEAERCYTLISQTPGGKPESALWARILCAHFLESIELGRQLGYGASTSRGVAHLAIAKYRRNKNNSRRSMKDVLKYVEFLHAEAESGRKVRHELEETAIALGVGRIVRAETPHGDLVIDDRGASRSATPAPVRVSVRDPGGRSEHLREAARRVAQDLPPPPTPTRYKGVKTIGEASPGDRAAWINWIDQVSRTWSAPLRARDLERISGAPGGWCAAMLSEYHAIIAQGLDEDARRVAALALSAEVEAISREAFTLAQSTDDERAKGAALKLALDAVKQRSALLQLDRVELHAPVIDRGASIADRLEKIGLDNSTLEAIADLASQAISEKH